MNPSTMGIGLSVVRVAPYGGSALWREPIFTYATRGTQDLTWEVPMLGNTRPRVYARGYLPPMPILIPSLTLGNTL